MIKPASRTTLYEEVTKQIIQMVKDGKWMPGDKIPGEIALSEAFEVSRNCIREALKSLELSGIIKAKPGRGTFLSQDCLRNINRMELLSVLKSESSIKELMETRLIIEPELGFLAAQRADEEDISELEALLKESIETIKKGTYTTEIGLDFHMIIAKASKNNILSKFLSSITDQLLAQRFLNIHRYLDNKELLKEVENHNHILDCIKNRDCEKTKKLLYNHIYDSMKAYENMKLIEKEEN
ncbi:FadR/GntR family transcriptional regulator [Clostridium oceanicum]|uniref:FadR/GntR family transcriptional regulator n=1 Tax=Clostridium oceanicum TaxID=1543 RepID=A0ABP3URV9_9CLOT